MIKPIQRTAYMILVGLFMLSFTMVACNNKSEKKTEETDTTKMMDTTTKPMDTTSAMDTSMKPKPTEQGDKPPTP